jgi:para-aminobenzoate synthetase
MHVCVSSGGSCREPDAAFFFADQFLAIDHVESKIYAVVLHNGSQATADAATCWLSRVGTRIAELPQTEPVGPPSAGPQHRQPEAATPASPSFQLAHSRAEYLQAISACMEELYAGNSYEICLTNQLNGRVQQENAWQFYNQLRSINAAPYSAWMDFGKVCSPQ